ncbi:T9SS C-terminal target domain-containing protein [Flavobacteriaceae bacterium]|nr:T9SS C-terminal target domain-containing protein [Flavobacteriaceae bacterium]
MLLLVIITLGIVTTKFILEKKSISTETEVDEITKLREKHKYFLENSPYKQTRDLSKKERKARALPPNGYFEQLWDRTLDPNLGYPNYRGALKIQHELIEANKNLGESIAFGVPGDSPGNAWIERGPNNIGGRTRGILFDPNDANNERVFAGGVSGGLWVNDDITDENSTWTLVPGVPENIAVVEIVYDPNNTNTLYIASGESYTSGNAIGNGVYRSTDGGVNWEMIFGGPEGTSAFNQSGSRIFVDGIFYINDIITRNNSGVTELYIAAASASAGRLTGGSSDPFGYLGINERGVYRSVDNGDTWMFVSIISTTLANTLINPNDLELDINNNIWLSTTREVVSGMDGGEVFRSTDGVNFNHVNTIPNARRTEIEPSMQNANIFYAAAAVSANQANIYITRDAFNTVIQLPEPDDVDDFIPSNDYSRTQAFYNLPIEADPNNENILYIGGIDLFRGILTSGSNSVQWSQISKWSNNNQLANLDVSLVHADQHAIVFNPTNSNEVVFGNDGGVYYTNNIATSGVEPNTNIEPRNKGYNVTQFYAADINNLTGNIGGGTQDNGTPYNFNPTGANDPFYTIISGDGIYGQFDSEGEYFIGSSQRINYKFFELPIQANLSNPSGPTPSVRTQITSNNYTIIDRDGGNFVNEADVDTNLDILYINASDGVSGGAIRIGRYSNLLQGSSANVRETLITDPLLTEVISVFKVSPHTTNSTRLLVGTEFNTLLNVANADTTPVFTEITGSNFVGSISDIEFGENSQTIMVTISNYGVDSIFYTEDDGATWTSKEGNLPDIPVFTILQSPLNPDEAIVGTQFGVFRTSNFLDASPIWQQSFNGMSNVPVRDLDLRPSTNEVLATTYGRGVFTGSFVEDPNGDNDGDGVLNDVDNCPNTPNADQADADNNGIGDVCQDIDNDGILDINDNCPNNANPDQADADGDGLGDVCDIPMINDQDNITVEIVSETCPGLDNGVITVTALATTFTYNANVTGQGVNIDQTFTSTTTFEDLPVGSYIVTVTVASENFERSFELNVDPSPPLNIDFDGVLPGARPNSQIYVFGVNEGTGPFEIRFNNELIRTTNESSIEVELSGSGLLEIIPSRLCEGIFSLEVEGLLNVNEVRAFPNPVINDLTVSIPGDISTVPVSIYNITGQLVYQENSSVIGNSITLPFSDMSEGVYFVRLEMETPVVLKIIK